MKAYDRRSFLKAAGVATGAAAISASPAAAAIEPIGVETTPTGPIPHEPVVAIVRDGGARRGHRALRNDREDLQGRGLVKRCSRRPGRNHRSSSGPGGVA